MNFSSFVSNFDEILIEKIVGKDTIQILNLIDSHSIINLQSTLLKVYPPIELLSYKDYRDDIFDLLKFPDAEALSIKLGKPGTDPYSELKSLKFKTYDEWSTLLNFFEIEIPTTKPDLFVQINKDVEPEYPLFKHQREAIQELDTKLYSGYKRVMLHMPTGSGKTRTAMNVISNHFRLHEPTLVIWLAHTEELCEQAASEFEKAWRLLGTRKIPVTRYWGNAKQNLAEIKDGFVVAGLNKLFNLLKTNAESISILAKNCSLVVMDEAHMAVAPTFNLNLQTLLSFNASLLGLSATPGRTWNDPEADRKLSEFFSKQKVTLKVSGYQNPVDYLVTEGYLAEVKLSPLLFSNGFKISEKDLEYFRTHFELSDSFLKKLSEDQKRNVRIVQAVENLVKSHKRILLFALGIEHSNLLATCLQARGIEAFSITSNTNPVHRKNLIEQFKSDEQKSLVLCNYGILTTGFDAPQTSCAVIARPTDSLVLYSQMVGRAIRGTRAGGNQHAEIVTVIDNCLPGFDKVANAFFNWEDVWN